MTIHITLHGIWSVAKYILTFGAGFATGAIVVLRGIGNSIGRAFGW